MTSVPKKCGEELRGAAKARRHWRQMGTNWSERALGEDLGGEGSAEYGETVAMYNQFFFYENRPPVSTNTDDNTDKCEGI